MEKRNWIILTMLLLVGPVFLQAQVLDNGQERQERSAADANLERDAREVRGMQISLARITEAWEIADMESVTAIKEDIMEAMLREIYQGNDASISATEARQSEIFEALLDLDEESETAQLEMIGEFIQLMEKDLAEKGGNPAPPQRIRN
jgi:hypothetical protein